MNRWLAVAMVVGCLAGCRRQQNRAQERFVEHYSCPADRVATRPLDGKPSTLMLHPTEAPDEIRGDSERYRIWADAQREIADRTDAEWECFQVTGCGHRERVCCADADEGGGICSEPRYEQLERQSADDS